MPSKLINFGETPYPKALDQIELNEKTMARIWNGYINSLKHKVKWPGLRAFATVGSSPIKGLFRTRSVSRGTMLFASGGVIYRLQTTGGHLPLNSVDAPFDTGRVSWTEDDTNVFAAAGGYIIKIDLTTNTWVKLDSFGPTGVTHIDMIDGFLIANGLLSGGRPGDTNFSDDKVNGYDASNSWESFNNESLGDSCNGLMELWHELYCFGPETIEVNFNDGATPFARIPGSLSPYGLVAPQSLVKVQNTIYYLTRIDNAYRFARLENRRPAVFDTAYDRELAALSTAEQAEAFTKTIDGDPFYIINFPCPDNFTLAYNMASSTWSQIGHWSGTQYDQYQCTLAAFWPEAGVTILGDKDHGILYELAGTTHNGDIIRMELTSSVDRRGTLHRKTENKLLLEAKQTTPLADGIGTYKIRWRENGQNFPATYVTLPMALDHSAALDGSGVLHQVYQQINSLGPFRERQYQIVHDGTTDFILTQAESDYTVNRH